MLVVRQATREHEARLGGRVPGAWTAEVQPLRDAGMSIPEIAAKFGKSRQAVHNVTDGQGCYLLVAEVGRRFLARRMGGSAAPVTTWQAQHLPVQKQS
jgi:hypothetical protein